MAPDYPTSSPTPVSSSLWSTQSILRHYSSSFLKGTTQQGTILHTVAIDIQMTGSLRKGSASATKFLQSRAINTVWNHKSHGAIWRGIEDGEVVETEPSLAVNSPCFACNCSWVSIHPLWNTDLGWMTLKILSSLNIRKLCHARYAHGPRA